MTIDPVLLRRVLDNLLENARKYSEADTTIRVETRATPSAVTIAVVDHGIGIDGADLARMFTPFFRTDRSRDRTTGGVGLGLVLARRVIEAHGGTIRITSEPQQGTTVTFELAARSLSFTQPRSPPAATRPGGPTARAPRSSPRPRRGSR